MNRKISVALWDDIFLQPFTAAFEDNDSFDVTVTSPARCEQLGLAGLVDLALMSSHMVLLHEDDLDVYGSAAISSWRFPYSRLVLNAPLGTPVDSVQYDTSDQIHAIVSRIILNEHYNFEPQFIPTETVTLGQKDTGIIDTSNVSLPAGDQTILDLGQEWFELTGYPMVWGLFATGKGNHTTRVAEALMTVASQFKLSNDSRSPESDDSLLEDFYSGEIRVGYDDLAIASLTQFSQFLYFYNIVDEPVAVPVIFDDGIEPNQS